MQAFISDFDPVYQVFNEPSLFVLIQDWPHGSKARCPLEKVILGEPICLGKIDLSLETRNLSQDLFFSLL